MWREKVQQRGPEDKKTGRKARYKSEKETTGRKVGNAKMGDNIPREKPSQMGKRERGKEDGIGGNISCLGAKRQIGQAENIERENNQRRKGEN